MCGRIASLIGTKMRREIACHSRVLSPDCFKKILELRNTSILNWELLPKVSGSSEIPVPRECAGSTEGVHQRLALGKGLLGQRFDKVNQLLRGHRLSS